MKPAIHPLSLAIVGAIATGALVVLAPRVRRSRAELHAELARAEAVQDRWGLPAVKWLKLFKPVVG